MDERALRIELDGMKGQMTLLYAENVAQQIVLTQLMSLMHDRPDLGPLVVQAFDRAANFTADVSIALGKRSGHIPETLRIIEQLRVGAVGGGKPKHGV